MPSYGLANGDMVEVRVNGTLFGQTTINTFHYKIGSGTPADNDLTELLNAFNDTVWDSNMSALVSEDLEAVFLQGQVISPARKVTHEIAASPTTGEVATAACPPTTAVVLRKRTIFAGKGFRGRIFVPGVPFASTAEGQLTTTPYNLAITVAAQLAATLAFNSRQATPWLYSTHLGQERAVITSGDADQVLRVQRRREIGKGV